MFYYGTGFIVLKILNQFAAITLFVFKGGVQNWLD